MNDAAFEEFLHPGKLAEIKLLTNALEMEWAVEGKRRINIDPGYVSHSKLVLATTKNHVHRIYLGQGIYAEVTLHFRSGTFQPWGRTYCDYASPPYLEIFNQIRALYTRQVKAISHRPFATHPPRAPARKQGSCSGHG